MKQRYISLMLSVVTLFLSAGVLFVYGQTYIAPTQPFPNGLVDKPIDTGNTGQPKGSYIAPTQLDLSDSSSLNVGLKLKTNQLIQSVNLNSIGLDNAGSIVLYSSAGRMNINTQGIVLPKLSSAPSPAEGMIYFDSTNKKVKLNTNGTSGGWTDIGTGSGGTTGDGFWTTDGSDGIKYGGGGVTISSVKTGWFFDTVIGNLDKKNGFSFTNITHAEAIPDITPCGVSDDNDVVDCPNSFYLNTKETAPAIGTYGYDKYVTYSCTNFADSLVGDQCCHSEGNFEYGGNQVCNPASKTTKQRRFIYQTKTGTLPAQLSVDGEIKSKVINVDEINITDPKWSKTNGEIQASGNRKDYSPDGHVENWVSCPDGYFVSAFRLGKSDDYLTPVIKCSKL